MVAPTQDVTLPATLSEFVVETHMFYHLKEDLPRHQAALPRSFSDSALHARAKDEVADIPTTSVQVFDSTCRAGDGVSPSGSSASTCDALPRVATSSGSESAESLEGESTTSDGVHDACISIASETSETADVESSISDAEHPLQAVVDADHNPLFFNWVDHSDAWSPCHWDGSAMWPVHYESMMQQNFGWSPIAARPEDSRHTKVPKTVNLEEEYVRSADTPITTVMLRNIPNGISQTFLVAKLHELGFEGTFDFLYIPVDGGTKTNVGYGFVNFVDSKSAQRCLEVLPGIQLTRRKGRKVLATSVAHLQGLQANLQHYNKSAVKNSRLRLRRPIVLSHAGPCPELCSMVV